MLRAFEEQPILRVLGALTKLEHSEHSELCNIQSLWRHFRCSSLNLESAHSALKDRRPHGCSSESRLRQKKCGQAGAHPMGNEPTVRLEIRQRCATTVSLILSGLELFASLDVTRPQFSWHLIVTAHANRCAT